MAYKAFYQVAPKTVYFLGLRFRLDNCYANKTEAQEVAAILRAHGWRAIVREIKFPHRFCVYKRRPS